MLTELEKTGVDEANADFLTGALDWREQRENLCMTLWPERAFASDQPGKKVPRPPGGDRDNWACDSCRRCELSRVFQTGYPR